MSDFKPILVEDFDVSKVSFSHAKAMSSGAKLFFLEYDGGPIVIQSPEMALTFDPQTYEDGPGAKYTVKTNMNLSNESCKLFHDKMVEFDERIRVLSKENSVEWFKKKNLSDDVIESMFTPTIRVHVDGETGEPSGRFPPTFGFKVKKKDGNFMCGLFNGSEPKIIVDGKRMHPPINVNDKEGENYMEFTKCMKKGTQVKGLFKCDFVWGPPNKLGATWSAQQLRIKVPKGFDEYAFMDDSDDEGQSEKLAQGNYIESESEDETVEAA
jgi:hypothetical protein